MTTKTGHLAWGTIALGCTGTVLAVVIFVVIYILIRKLRLKKANVEEDFPDFAIPKIRVYPGYTAIGGSTPETVQPYDYDPDLLDPGIYKSDDEELERPGSPYSGVSRLCFSLNYERRTEKLKVKLIRATRLTSKGTSVTATPYVKLCLLPDKRRKIQSRIHRTSNPEFNEDFMFPVPEDELRTRTLKFTICDFDRFSRQHVIGHVVYPLTDIDATMQYDETEIWMDIEGGDNTKTPSVPKGELLFCLQFLPTASRLTIIIMKAKDLHLEDELGDLNPYVKVSMVLGGKTCKKKNTTIAKRTCNPVFNEAFGFNIPPACLNRVSFIMSVINAPRLGGTRKLIGRCVVGPYMYSTGTGLGHWNDMLDSMRSPVCQWHSLM